MSNPILTFFGKVGKVLAWPFVHLTQVIAILTTTLNDYPAVRAALTGLITQIQTNVQDVATAAGSDGLNVAADVAELAAAKSLFSYVQNTFLPALEKAYNDELGASAAKSAAAVKAKAARKIVAFLTPPLTSSNTTTSGVAVHKDSPA